MAEVDCDHRRWSIVSARIDLIPGRKNLLRVRARWNEGLKRISIAVVVARGMQR